MSDVSGATRVVSRRAGEPYDVYVGRPSIWGNPFMIGRDGTREEVVARYEAYLLSRPDLLARLGELRGRVLACWCAPEACHADVLSRYADAGEVPAGFEPVLDARCWCGAAAGFWSSSGDGYACEAHRGSLFVAISPGLRVRRWAARREAR